MVMIDIRTIPKMVGRAIASPSPPFFELAAFEGEDSVVPAVVAGSIVEDSELMFSANRERMDI